MKRVEVAFAASALAALAVAGSVAPALAARRSRPEDRAKAVRLTRQLEKDPLGADAPAARSWLARWLAKVPDITVTVRDLLGPLPNDSYPYSSPIFNQMIFSNAAFVIENPDRARDEVAAQTAGIEGALKVYEAILRTRPDARLAFFDALVEKRDSGKLERYVRESIVEQTDR